MNDDGAAGRGTRRDATRRDEAQGPTDDIVINVSELLAEPVEVAVLFFLYHSTLLCLSFLAVLFAFFCPRPLPPCGTRQHALQGNPVAAQGVRAFSGVARNPYKKHSFAARPQEAKQHVQDIVESPQRSARLSSVLRRHFCVCSAPFFLSELARCQLSACLPACLPPFLAHLPFWVSIQLQLSSLNCGTHSRAQKKTGKRGNSLDCQVPIVGFTFGPDKLKCPRTIPGVDFLFMCPLALSLTIVFGLRCGLPFRFFSAPSPPVLRSCSASGKPLN